MIFYDEQKASENFTGEIQVQMLNFKTEGFDARSKTLRYSHPEGQI